MAVAARACVALFIFRPMFRPFIGYRSGLLGTSDTRQSFSWLLIIFPRLNTVVVVVHQALFHRVERACMSGMQPRRFERGKSGLNPACASEFVGFSSRSEEVRA